jgi:hypothetical protein
MDDERKIRFLIPPTLFLTSLIWGAIATPNCLPTLDWLHDLLKNDSLGKIVGAAAVGGLIVFVAGYVIGSVTLILLRLMFSFLRLIFFVLRYCRLQSRFSDFGRFYEVALDDKTLDELARRWRVPGAPWRDQKRAWELFAAVAFDHGGLFTTYRGVHDWLVRRGGGFLIAANSILGLGLSFLFGWWVGIPLACRWYAPVGGFALLLFVLAIYAWLDTMRMLTFMIWLQRDLRRTA